MAVLSKLGGQDVLLLPAQTLSSVSSRISKTLLHLHLYSCSYALPPNSLSYQILHNVFACRACHSIPNLLALSHNFDPCCVSIIQQVGRRKIVLKPAWAGWVKLVTAELTLKLLLSQWYWFGFLLADCHKACSSLWNLFKAWLKLGSNLKILQRMRWGNSRQKDNFIRLISIWNDDNK